MSNSDMLIAFGYYVLGLVTGIAVGLAVSTLRRR